ncbi:MAG: hypothetical protein H7144_08785 [Burkholderiales bacterium]|nr:hypothetical protein [Phycisphaerae bacterium]
MKTGIFKAVLLSTAMVFPMAMSTGCAREVAHSESERDTMFGGRKKEETTVYKNADGTTSVERRKSTVNP